jgi:signal transduction histidine kinase
MEDKTKKQALINFQALFEAAPGLFLILMPDTPSFTILGASDAYLKATMTERNNITGRGLFEVFPDNPDDQTATGTSNLRKSLENVYKNKAADKMSIQKYDIQRPKLKGGGFEERYWSPLNSPVLNKKNEIEYIIHCVEDVTEFVLLKQKSAEEIEVVKTESEEKLKKLNGQLYENVIQLEGLNKELESFSYSVSHDLRAPLRAIDGYAGILEEDYGKMLDEEGNRLLEAVHYNAKKMGNLIDDLLAFSRLGKKEPAKTNLNMNELVEGALYELNKSIKHQATVKIKKLHSVKGDYGLINQVVINLLSNAIKYSSKVKNPLIEISSEKTDVEVIYLIKDNGAGFDMRYVHKLFGVFQRLHTVDEFEGTGVGLAIVKRIMAKHGGKVSAEGEKNKGAIFKFSLPIN